MTLITNEVKPNYIAITAKWLACIILAICIIYGGYYIYLLCKCNWNKVIFASVSIFFVICAIVSDISSMDGDEDKETSEHEAEASPPLSSNSRREKPKEIFSKQIAYVTDNGGSIEAYSDEGHPLWCKGALNARVIGYTSSTVSIGRSNVGIKLVDVHNARGSCIRAYRGR